MYLIAGLETLFNTEFIAYVWIISIPDFTYVTEMVD
jgi:hypothetical protein